ncbi:MAG: HAD hydrolase-like protein [Lachnospiraceae bacterium]|jgi:phosphoglycolate phosphatase|nr:HAD hydrolase-like protein [Lachnospiraceae bacterium]MCH4030366.1 HAD hydrolase-like protein [Lachnospiraceae bacterium]MCH4069578.1 HAD hydrolase-like protein [Lachnospiraceae bacterium]MCH4107486.1 HAD hydrolase-like protein [Lachnospiraceae bacterium]MCI1301663.1 HAD hydrolase-like protein [Lachnospiraceae bacterium]
MRKFLLFDLDGTITDSGPGIRRCAQYALESFGIHETDVANLNRFVGPPLNDSFRDFYGLDEKQSIQAVKKYRERYETTGLYENSVIPGIPELLRTARDAGYVNVLATSKPEVFAVRILAHFGLSEDFAVVSGADLAGKHVVKSDIIRTALERIQDRFPEECRDIPGVMKQCVMIGDRKEDVLGAHQVGIPVIGVRFGFAVPGELEKAGADAIADTPEDVMRAVKKIEGTPEAAG